MFMQRLLSAIILIPIVLLLLFYGPAWLLLSVVIAVLLLATRECWGLIPLSGRMVQTLFLVAMALCFGLSNHYFLYSLYTDLLLWAAIILMILFFPKSQTYWGHSGVVALLCLVTIPVFCQSVLAVYGLPHGKWLFLYVLLLIWATDSGAYLVGKRWGRHKIIPKVSPGKSWEGLLGGFALVILVALGGYHYLHVTTQLSLWLLLALGIALISVFGDLFVSILKRRCGLKDTGNLIPGHGGLLDRLDSIIAATPFYYWGLQYILPHN